MWKLGGKGHWKLSRGSLVKIIQDTHIEEGDELPIDDTFLDEHLWVVNKVDAPTEILWISLLVEYYPRDSIINRKEIFFLLTLNTIYGWALTLQKKKWANTIYRRCVPENEIKSILYHCHSLSNGGHADTFKITGKVYKLNSSSLTFSKMLKDLWCLVIVVKEPVILPKDMRCP